ncbi:MAG: dephospho-CoA kinase [Clostridia bacterium]|nr:dephospho-CoA kinase [Clostridia bacterium]
MKIIGLTGGIGSGKSTVSDILKELGYIVVDADRLSREACKVGSPLLRLLVKEFGIDIICENGTLDRKKLADLAFSDRDGTRRLNELVQTAILVKAMEYFNDLRIEKKVELCFFDVPMLFEAEWDKYTDAVWLVIAPESVRLSRVVNRDKSRREAVLARMRLQLTDEEKIARSDVIIDNSGSEEYLREQVEEAVKSLL